MRPLVLLALAFAFALCAPGCGEDPSEVVIWAVGDGGVDNEPSRKVVEMIAKDDPAHVIYLGDVYETGTPEEFETFGDVWRPLVKRTWPTPGNHEWPSHETGYDKFWRDQPYTYTRSAAGWKLISANSQTPDSAAQLRWLREQVAGGGTCRIAFWHRPRWNAGEHRDEEGAVAEMWAAVKGRAAILLSGHDHNLQRFKPVAGTTQLISGAGGKSHYPVDATDSRLAYSNDTADGALRIVLSPGRARLTFVSTDGKDLDTSTVRCRG